MWVQCLISISNDIHWLMTWNYQTHFSSSTYDLTKSLQQLLLRTQADILHNCWNEGMGVCSNLLVHIFLLWFDLYLQLKHNLFSHSLARHYKLNCLRSVSWNNALRLILYRQGTAVISFLTTGRKCKFSSVHFSLTNQPGGDETAWFNKRKWNPQPPGPSNTSTPRLILVFLTSVSIRRLSWGL